jgi:hypothetical protein
MNWQHAVSQRGAVASQQSCHSANASSPLMQQSHRRQSQTCVHRRQVSPHAARRSPPRAAARPAAPSRTTQNSPKIAARSSPRPPLCASRQKHRSAPTEARMTCASTRAAAAGGASSASGSGGAGGSRAALPVPGGRQAVTWMDWGGGHHCLAGYGRGRGTWGGRRRVTSAPWGGRRRPSTRPWTGLSNRVPSGTVCSTSRPYTHVSTSTQYGGSTAVAARCSRPGVARLLKQIARQRPQLIQARQLLPLPRMANPAGLQGLQPGADVSE